MKKTLLTVGFLTAFSAHADLVGTYTCSTNQVTTVKINGKTTKAKSGQTTTMILNADGTAIGINPAIPFETHSTWSASGSKFNIVPNQDDLVKTANYSCEQSGVKCVFVGDTYKSNLTINKAQTVIKGKNTLTLTMLMNGIYVYSTAVANTTCAKH
jgi:hypothetical protein